MQKYEGRASFNGTPNSETFPAFMYAWEFMAKTKGTQRKRKGEGMRGTLCEKISIVCETGVVYSA